MHISTYRPLFLQLLCSSMLLATPVAALAADAAPNPAQTQEWVVFNGKTASPYTMFLGSPTNWAYPLPDGESLNIGSIKAESTQINAPGDGRKVSWNGGIGQLYVQAKSTQDLADWLDEDSALVFDTVVHSAPQDSVTIRVDCRYPCLGVIEAQEIFKALPLNQKATVKIPLSCFAKSGAKFTSVNTPFLFYTTAKFSMSFANVRYVRGAAKDADARKACA
ncbi:putative glycoside hydrolase [Massilia sp. W12]|uniref:putative glycoside hydrolase n=1 Tax=Massilia sp. W12 TaxID=3126507 RepID=UPI0030CB4EC1